VASVNPRRSYRSTIRRGDAPQAILTAATTLFRTKGYLATSIDDIAAEAGVARPTVFAAVGPKPTMLKLVVDHATTGDDAPIPVAERAWSREALDAEDPATSLRLHARNSRRICERVADLLWAVESAAAVDPDAAALWADLQEQRRSSMRTFVQSLARKTELQEDVRTITETLWAMIPALYLRLVRDAGWPPDRFETWLGDTFIQLWLP
jgi:TetR/AcrR family transcriptional regulator, regulator of autoinduction and epiphytic fitness